MVDRGLVRRLQRDDGAADRSVVRTGDRSARRPFRDGTRICSARVRRSATSVCGGSCIARGPIPTAGALIEGRAPTLLAWIQRMLWPRAEGEFAVVVRRVADAEPLLETIVGRLFLPWSVANAHAIATNAESFSVTLDGRMWTQKPQKYHARSLASAARKIRGDADKRAIDAVLQDAGCLDSLLTVERSRWIHGVSIGLGDGDRCSGARQGREAPPAPITRALSTIQRRAVSFEHEYVTAGARHRRDLMRVAGWCLARR